MQPTDKLSLKQTLEMVFPEAKPGHKKFLYFAIRGWWRSLCQKNMSVSNSTRLDREIAVPFVKKMIPVAIAEITSKFLKETSTQPSISTTNVSDFDNLEDMKINEPESESDDE
jgi:hypothetical protein